MTEPIAVPEDTNNHSLSSQSAEPPSVSQSANQSVNQPDVAFDLQNWIVRQTKLLEAERDADIESTNQSITQSSEADRVRSGVTLAKLWLIDCRQGLYGRTICTFSPSINQPVKSNKQSKSDDSNQTFKRLPTSRISVRDIVQIQPKGQPINQSISQSDKQASGQAFDWSNVTGVVHQITDHSINIAIDEYPPIDSYQSISFSLTKVADDVTYQKYNKALKALSDRGIYNQAINRSTNQTVSCPPLRVIYGGQNPTFNQSNYQTMNLSPSAKLNSIQVEAVKKALEANELCLIHGPPGTGKTTVLVEIIVQAVARGDRVLVCAPSNIAVDNLVERLIKANEINQSNKPSIKQKQSNQTTIQSISQFRSFRPIRLGHPARLSASILDHSLDATIKQSNGGMVAKDIRSDMQSVEQSINQSRNRDERKKLRSEWKMLQSELRKREKKAVVDCLIDCPVICSTLIGAASQAINQSNNQFFFDTVVIDECAQALEVACLIPMLRCSGRLILAGDHCQLGPVIQSNKQSNRQSNNESNNQSNNQVNDLGDGLDVTLFDRLSNNPLIDQSIIMLEQQYRMNDAIMQWTSGEFYNNRLNADESIKQQRLVDSSANQSVDQSLNQSNEELNDGSLIKSNIYTRAPFVFIDTAGCEMYEDDQSINQSANQATNQSKSNRHEVELVAQYVSMLQSSNQSNNQITVLSPYLAQIQLLRDRLENLQSNNQSIKSKGKQSNNQSNQKIEIGTVDSMQGRENDCIIISMVRSSPIKQSIKKSNKQSNKQPNNQLINQQLGFLTDARRLNVAITRARCQVVLIGDSELLSEDPFLGRLVKYAQSVEGGEFVSANDWFALIEQSNDQSIDQSVVDWSHKKADVKPVDNVQLNNQPVTQENKQKSEKKKQKSETLNNQSINQSTDQPIDQTINQSPNQLVTEIFDREKIEEICRQVLGLSISPTEDQSNHEYVFPAAMSSEQRKLVHEVAETINQSDNQSQYELIHESSGKGSKRAVVLRRHDRSTEKPSQSSTSPPIDKATKPATQVNKEQNKKSKQQAVAQATNQPSDRAAQRAAALDRLEAAAKQAKPSAGQSTTQPAKQPVDQSVSQSGTQQNSLIDSSPIDKSNDQSLAQSSHQSAFHSLMNESDDESKEDDEQKVDQSVNQSVNQTNNQTAPQVKKKQKKQSNKVSVDDDDDLDSLLSDFSSGVSNCAQCQVKLTQFSESCRFCRLKHCMKHSNPILHGCAASAKQHALNRDLTTFSEKQAGRTGHGLDEVKRKLLANKLHQKADAARKAGEKEGKKKETKKK